MGQKDWKNVSVWGLRRRGKPKILKIKEDFGTGGEITEWEQNVLLPAGSTQAMHRPLSSLRYRVIRGCLSLSMSGNSLNTTH